MTHTPAPSGTGSPERRVLVAGIGNVFLGDDGFGVEAVRRLAAQPLPDGVETTDTGVRGVHLAYQLLDGYHTVVLVDATRRGGEPGDVYLIEADTADADSETDSETALSRGALMDAHRMTPDTVLALLDTLSAGTGGARPQRVLVVGCEPACLEEGVGLSGPVAAAVDEAVRVVREVLSDVPDARQPAAQRPPNG